MGEDNIISNGIELFALFLITEIPDEKLEKMRATGGFYGMPDDGAALGRRIFSRGNYRKIRDALCEEMNFTGIIFSETGKNFGEGAFGAVSAVQKGRDDGQAQLKVLRSAACGIGPEPWRAGP